MRSPASPAVKSSSHEHLVETPETPTGFHYALTHPSIDLDVRVNSDQRLLKESTLSSLVIGTKRECSDAR